MSWWNRADSSSCGDGRIDDGGGIADERAGDARPYGRYAHVTALYHCHTPNTATCRGGHCPPADERFYPVFRLIYVSSSSIYIFSPQKNGRAMPAPTNNLRTLPHYTIVTRPTPPPVGAGIARPRMRFHPVFRLFYVSSSGIYIVFPQKNRRAMPAPTNNLRTLPHYTIVTRPTPPPVGAGIARPWMRFYPVFRLIYESSSGIYIVFPPKKRAGDARPYEGCENSPALSRAGDVFIRHLIPFTRYSSKALSVRSDSSVSRRSNTPLPPGAPASRTTFSAGPSPRKPIL